MGGKPTVCSIDDYSTVGVGKAKPEYIVTFNKDKNTIILVECKKSIKDHESSEKICHKNMLLMELYFMLNI